MNLWDRFFALGVEMERRGGAGMGITTTRVSECLTLFCPGANRLTTAYTSFETGPPSSTHTGSRNNPTV